MIPKKLWDCQQNFSGLVVIYVAHTQRIPPPEGPSIDGVMWNCLSPYGLQHTELITSLTRYSLLKNVIVTHLHYSVSDINERKIIRMIIIIKNAH